MAVAWKNKSRSIPIPSASLDSTRLDVQRSASESADPGAARARTVLVVGGAGYIGSVLTDHLLSHGYRVRSFDLLLFNNQTAVLPHMANPAYEFMRGDLTDTEHMTDALDGVSDVVLLAGLVGDPITRKYPDAARKINDDGHQSMIRLLAGRGLGNVVFVSTCSNYGFVEGDHLAAENQALTPLSPYAVSKVAVEEQLLGLSGKVDYAPTVLRFATAFGLSPRMRFDLTVNEFTRELFLGNELVVYDRDTWRPYCHVLDFAEAIRSTLEAPVDDVAFEVFNAGGEDNNFTKQMIVDAVLAEVPHGKARYQKRGSDARNYRVSFAKIRRRLGFEPRYAVSDGIRELVGAAEQGLFANIDEPRGFYGNHEISY